MKVFLDTNIFLDYLQERSPGSEHAHKILKLAEINQIQACTTAISLSNVIYVLNRGLFKRNEISRSISELLEFVEIIQTLSTYFLQAFHSRFEDLEDGLQYSSALNDSKIFYFITQNKKHFRNAVETLPVLTAKEFVEQEFI